MMSTLEIATQEYPSAIEMNCVYDKAIRNNLTWRCVVTKLTKSKKKILICCVNIDIIVPLVINSQSPWGISIPNFWQYLK